MPIEQHIEELRAELRNCCDVVERAQIEGELETALAERQAMLAGTLQQRASLLREAVPTSRRRPGDGAGFFADFGS